MSKTASLFLISVRFQRSRSTKHPDKPGVVYIEIAQNCKDKDGEASRSSMRMNTSLTGTPETYVDSNKEAIIDLVRMAYCVIENHAETDSDVSVDKVMSDFRKAVKGDILMKDSINRSKEDFPFKADLVNVGDDLKRFFRFDYASKDKDNNMLVDFMEARAFQFRNEGKVASSRSYLSTKNSLTRFVGYSQVKLCDVDRGFVEGYAQWLTKNGVSENTQSFYLRTLRSALNHASDAGFITVPDNLFEGLNTKVLIPPKRKKGTNIDNTVVSTKKS